MTNERIPDLTITIIIIIDIDLLHVLHCLHHQDQVRRDHRTREMIDHRPHLIRVVLRNEMIIIHIVIILREIIIHHRNLPRLVIVHRIVVLTIQIHLVQLAFLLPLIRMIRRQIIVKQPKKIKIDYTID